MKTNDNRLKAYKKMEGLLKSSQKVNENKTDNGTFQNSAFESSKAKNQNVDLKNQDTKEKIISENPFIKKICDGEKKEKYDPSKESVYRRVAKFLLIIGIDEAAKILPYLSQEQTEKIIPEIASIRSIDSDEAAVILAEFENLVQKSRNNGGLETAKSILVKAFGAQRAEEMLEKAVPLKNEKPFEYMQEMDSERVSFFIKDESVAIQALVLSYLKPQVSADVIKSFPDKEKTAVICRLANLKSISPEVLRRVDQAMHEKIKNANTVSADKIDGRGALADILKKMPMNSEKEILSMLSETDPDLTNELRNRLFTVEDFLNCDDKFLQKKLQSMSETEIAYLIADKDEKFRQKIFKNISKTRGDVVLEELELKKPMKKSDVSAITDDFFAYLRKKWESGELIILGSDDVYV